jgi:2-polyprenyl-6-hydroxyphenyl methylase/3-demethylubiquinone-9 3-methyltransferase
MQAKSIDPKEIAHYDALADQWWNTQGQFWPLHRLNALRCLYLKNAICDHFGRDPDTQLPLDGLRMVDIGCGGGILSESMARLGANVHGIDVTEKNILIARQHSAQQALPIEYEYTSVEEVATRNTSYDVVLNMEVVEHVADLPHFMTACSSLVADHGIMFIATINRNLISWLFAIFGAEYILRWLPRGTHTWHKLVRPNELDVLLYREGLTVTSRHGVRINPFTRAFSLSDRTTVNYMLSARREQKVATEKQESL